MPKLRNATTDLGLLAQYFARKAVIHFPHMEVDLTAEDRAKQPRIGKSRDPKRANVHMLSVSGSDAEPSAFVAITPKGRAFRVMIDEVNPEDLDPELFSEVGK